MRYEKYYDIDLPWIKEVPEHWSFKKVKDFFEISRGRVIPKEELDSDAIYPVYSSQTVNRGIMGFLNTYDYEGSAITWTTDGEKAGTVFFRSGKFNCTNICGILTSKSEQTDYQLKYHAYALSVACFHNRRKDTNGYKIMSGEMKSINYPIPPLQEQEQIANFLDWKINDIDGLIKKEREIQAEIDDLLLATIDKAIGNVQCEYVKLKGVFAFGKGLGITKDNLGEEGIKCINYGEIHNLPNCRFSSTDTNLKGLRKKDGVTISKSSILEEGDFVFADTSEDLLGSGNFGWLVDGLNPIYAGYHTVVAKPKIIFYPMFMEFCLKSNIWRDQVRSIVKGVKVYSITQLLLKNTLVPLPEMDIQKEIADELNQFTIHCKNMKLASLNKVSELNQLKQSLISAAVTGKIDVRDIIIPEYEKVESVFEEDEDQVEGGEDEWD